MASSDVGVDVIARIIDPSAWQFYDRAIQPYLDNRGSRNDENWIYQITWGRHGFRNSVQVDDWLRRDDPQHAESCYGYHTRLQDSLDKARRIYDILV